MMIGSIGSYIDSYCQDVDEDARLYRRFFPLLRHKSEDHHTYYREEESDQHDHTLLNPIGMIHQ